MTNIFLGETSTGFFQGRGLDREDVCVSSRQLTFGWNSSNGYEFGTEIHHHPHFHLSLRFLLKLKLNFRAAKLCGARPCYSIRCICFDGVMMQVRHCIMTHCRWKYNLSYEKVTSREHIYGLLSLLLYLFPLEFKPTFLVVFLKKDRKCGE